ncbi:MAG: lipoyl synthase [Verrucomicrobia bacterium]|nr:MAG: lipoyl synthase [Verrucomicrobiota bacterium]
MQRLPTWIRQPLRTDLHYGAVQRLITKNALHTVCHSAHCPNQQECWNRGTATFMILGNTCTRACKFCNISTGRPDLLDAEEPRHVAEAAQKMNLRHVVITSVTRDDLPDGGSAHFAATIAAVRAALPAATIEVLTPDFNGDTVAINVVLEAQPDVFNHNLETVRRLQGEIRPHAGYEQSLSVLRHAASSSAKATVKSGVMVGLGETDDELLEAFRDLRAAGCELLTVGQYLRPRNGKHDVARFVTPAAFAQLAAAARAMGFRNVAAGPLVRSSYRAEELTQTPLPV